MTLLTDAELEAIRAMPEFEFGAWANFNQYCTFAWFSSARQNVDALLAHIAALTEQLDIAKRNAEQVALLSEKVQE